MRASMFFSQMLKKLMQVCAAFPCTFPQSLYWPHQYIPIDVNNPGQPIEPPSSAVSLLLAMN